MDYRDTLNLPQTKFKMKANLNQKEPMYLKRWEKEDLYGMLQEHAEGKPLYVLHDGPPYANGHIHLGTAFNKILKDIILKSKRMAGFQVPYIPGWDCHGLPIEHNVDQELGEKKNSIPKISKRGACRKYAEKWIKIQKDEFKRLGVLGDWDNPYLTMNYDYQATIAREFNTFLLSGSVTRNKKPVYWCSTCTTALAEAEVEYYDHTSPSIYVKFPILEDFSDIDSALSGDTVSVLIWTTTPWTLPANLAVAFHPDFEYAAVKTGDEILIIAKEMVESVMAEMEISEYSIVSTFSAKGLENRKCRHPFLDRDSLLVLANYVTLEAGTGCVHTAPGHGADDYLTGLRYGLEILSPVDSEGRYTEEAGQYVGQQVPAVNKVINADMAASGVLLHEDAINHSYPHCWRCKKPVMYRATPQWFISMESNDLKQKALAEIEKVQWTPSWAMQRIQSMVENRPDWCLSRQRTWGVPITVVSCKACGEVVKSEALVARIDELFRKEGADAWFRYELSEFMEEGCTCSACGGNEFEKEEDILDVWFDSGSSHAAVVEARDELRLPADLYLEGSDQHRGWFQTSLLTSVGTRGCAPYKGVLTHGYVVDGQGKKMSKSVGNVVAPSEVIQKFGAEILRLWVSSEDYRDDVKVSDEILKQVADSYRKIRNTIRYMLGNVTDFDPSVNAVEFEKMEEIDRWALGRFEEFREKVTTAYENYEFHPIHQALNYFCGTTMSSFYLDILKDRLYCSGTDSLKRRSAQTVLHEILGGLLQLMSPVLTFTTTEAWEHFKQLDEKADLKESIFFTEFPAAASERRDSAQEERWDKLILVRSAITKALEAARREKCIGHPLEAEVLIEVTGDWATFIEQEWDQVKDVCIISVLTRCEDRSKIADLDFFVSEEIPELAVAVRAASGEKCDRCWIRDSFVGSNADHPQLCERCLNVVLAMDIEE
jgi:isoleucyl-tRNA synthetase